MHRAESATATSLSRGPRLDPIGEASCLYPEGENGHGRGGAVASVRWTLAPPSGLATEGRPRSSQRSGIAERRMDIFNVLLSATRLKEFL